MYIRTREGLGQGQARWSTFQTFNRPTVQPPPIDYLGNFNEHMGKARSGSCEYFFIVEDFGRGSSELRSHIKKDIQDNAIKLADLIKRKLPPKPAGWTREIRVRFDGVGHVDKSTDPKNFGDLDKERAIAVGKAFEDQLWPRIAWLPTIDSFRSIGWNAGGRGPHFPRPGIIGGGNRRVEVCVGTWEIKDHKP